MPPLAPLAPIGGLPPLQGSLPPLGGRAPLGGYSASRTGAHDDPMPRATFAMSVGEGAPPPAPAPATPTPPVDPAAAAPAKAKKKVPKGTKARRAAEAAAAATAAAAAAAGGAIAAAAADDPAEEVQEEEEGPTSTNRQAADAAAAPPPQHSAPGHPLPPGEHEMPPPKGSALPLHAQPQPGTASSAPAPEPEPEKPSTSDSPQEEGGLLAFLMCCFGGGAAAEEKDAKGAPAWGLLNVATRCYLAAHDDGLLVCEDETLLHHDIPFTVVELKDDRVLLQCCSNGLFVSVTPEGKVVGKKASDASSEWHRRPASAGGADKAAAVSEATETAKDKEQQQQWTFFSAAAQQYLGAEPSVGAVLRPSGEDPAARWHMHATHAAPPRKQQDIAKVVEPTAAGAAGAAGKWGADKTYAVLNTGTQRYLAVREAGGALACEDADAKHPDAAFVVLPSADDKFLLQCCVNSLYVSRGPDNASLVGKKASDASSEWQLEEVAGGKQDEYLFRFVHAFEHTRYLAAGKDGAHITADTAGTGHRWLLQPTARPAPALHAGKAEAAAAAAVPAAAAAGAEPGAVFVMPPSHPECQRCRCLEQAYNAPPEKAGFKGLFGGKNNKVSPA